MTVYRITPDLVYVRTAKTAGTTIFEGVFRKTFIEATNDRFPDEWKGLYSFGVIRHPLDRFCSAYRMFRDGPCQYGGSLWQFYTDAMDERFPISSREPPKEDPDYWHKAIRYHASPQTAEINQLQHARNIIRFEALGLELNRALRGSGVEMPLKLPHLNRTFPTPFDTWQSLLSVELAQRLSGFYATDFSVGGYAAI